MCVVGFPDLVVWPEESLNILFVSKIQDGRHLTR